MTHIYVRTTESLDCDGISLSAADEHGRALPVEKVSSERAYRSETIFWRVTIPAGEQSSGDA